ncbi:uncharacterized protein LOC129227419 isoform X1 [Uloborus diversus]|uniref:uncharacterized protein LOC129227419 isoform X1 n=1 Tax=Uloborus diversus TaxID=327109 RepID=UPI00240A8942|nr:uncharacterized protein LOC129227419 isoform X1 [Uloborus diversus]
MEHRSRKRKNKTTSCISNQNHAAKYSNRSSAVLQEQFDHSNIVNSSNQLNLSHTKLAQLNANKVFNSSVNKRPISCVARTKEGSVESANERKKSSKKRTNTSNRCANSLESDTFKKSRTKCNKQMRTSKQTVSICPLEISLSPGTPGRNAPFTSTAADGKGRQKFPIDGNVCVVSDLEDSSNDNFVEASAAFLSMCMDESKRHSYKSPLGTKFSSDVEESVLSQVLNKNSVEKSLLKLPLISDNICNLIGLYSALEKCNQKSKEISQVQPSKEKTSFGKQNRALGEKTSLCDYELDSETEENEIHHQTKLKKIDLTSDASSTKSENKVIKSMKGQVKSGKKKILSDGRIKVNYFKAELVKVPDKPKNFSLRDKELDGEIEESGFPTSETCIANISCQQTNEARNNVTSDASSSGTKNSREVVRQKKRVSFAENIEINGVGVSNKVRQSTTTETYSVVKSLLTVPQMSKNSRNPLNEVHSELEKEDKKGKAKSKIQSSRQKVALKNRNKLGKCGEKTPLCDYKFDGETENIAIEICDQNNLDSDPSIGTNNMAGKRMNRKSVRHRKKRFTFCGSDEEDNENVHNLRRSTRTRRTPLSPWRNERARYRILENGDIAFIDITDK